MALYFGKLTLPKLPKFFHIKNVKKELVRSQLLTQDSLDFTKDHFTKLIVLDSHKRVLHSGVKKTIVQTCEVLDNSSENVDKL